MFSSVPVGIRISVSASEGSDEGPNDVNQLGGELIELSIPKLKLKRTNDVSDLLIQIKNMGLEVSRAEGARCRRVDLSKLVFVVPASAISAVAAAGNVMAIPEGRCCPSAS